MLSYVIAFLVGVWLAWRMGEQRDDEWREQLKTLQKIHEDENMVVP